MKATLSRVDDDNPLVFLGCIGYNISGGVVQIIIDEDEVYAYNLSHFFSFKYEQEEGVFDDEDAG